MFLFPKTDVITLDDKDVELVTRLGNDEVKKKFKLADMVFGGQLALGRRSSLGHVVVQLGTLGRYR